MQDFKNFDPRQSAMDAARAMLEQAAKDAMNDGTLPQKELPSFVVEVPGDVKNGDLAANLAMASARVFGMPPRKIAEAITAHLPALEGTLFDRVEVAGPGFINLFLNMNWYANVVLAANVAGADYGRTDFGKGEKVNVEFVSANPTGPMHLGNARGGALGDCLAAALDWAGYDVTREFYINDAGNQILKFGKSLATRYLQIFKGEDAVPFPEDGYQGEDIKVLARQFADEVGDRYVDGDFETLQTDIAAFGLPINVQRLKDDMGKYRVQYDVWFSETGLHQSGAIADILDKLAQRGATYEKDGAIWYRSMQYAEKYGGNKVTRKGLDGEVTDEAKDEVLVRANGVPTYFAADIAYHYNKFVTRGFSRAIDVWGADHHGHVARMKGAMDAIGLDGEKLDIVLMQFVRLMQDGKPVRMSKRTGKAIGLAELLDEVPIDSARFQFNLREPGSVMDFDMDAAVAQDNQNPVYYVQYAHARICSILKKMAQEGIVFEGADKADLTLLTEPSEMDLIRHIANFPGEIISAAKSYDPARITRYVTELANRYHKFYNSCRVKDAEPAVCQARLALCTASKTVISNALTMMKITVPESM
ncbi:arginine--tRNA ligase [Ruthenibacterium sp. CLA-JM-H11]|uniref:Arginine--tRNA ligase n=1 Tax=Ruthenibacterium intestinale TaxID=3133163 RepID=A0ABV1GCL1_9FIRM